MCIGYHDHHSCNHSSLAWTQMCSIALAHTDFDTRAPCVWREEVASMSRTKCKECRERDGLKRKRDDDRTEDGERDEEKEKEGKGVKLRKV